jgi:DNA-binding beta-propeller fold protein YncE
VARPVTGQITALARVPGRSMITVGSDDGTVALLATDGGLLRVLGRGDGAVISLTADTRQRAYAVLANGHVVAYDTGTGATLWDRRLGPPRANGQPHPATIAYDLRRDRLAIGFAGGTARILDPATGDTWLSVAVDEQPTITAVAFDQGSGSLVASARDGTLRVLDPITGRLLTQPVPGPATGVEILVTGDTGPHAATRSFDGTVTIWDTAARRMLARLPAAARYEHVITMSADGNSLLVAEPDGTATVWNLNEDAWLQAACTLAGRQLTPDEWRRLLPGRDYAPAC